MVTVALDELELLTRLEELSELLVIIELDVKVAELIVTELDIDDFKLDELEVLFTSALDVVSELAGGVLLPPPPHALRVKLSADKAAS